LEQVIETDGELAESELSLATAQALEEGGPWGQGFPEPLFEGVFSVREMRPIGATGTHVRYRLDLAGRTVDAVDFGGAERAVNRGRIRLLYKLAVSRFRGVESLEMRVEHLWSAD
jgi:single-stranded-DNA-specific exonuclease